MQVWDFDSGQMTRLPGSMSLRFYPMRIEYGHYYSETLKITGAVKKYYVLYYQDPAQYKVFYSIEQAETLAAEFNDLGLDHRIVDNFGETILEWITHNKGQELTD
jgi:hypothetical protein